MSTEQENEKVLQNFKKVRQTGVNFTNEAKLSM